MIPILTIDGPSGSGKGTISRLVAQHFGWHFLDSGAMYRALGLFVLWENCALNEEQRIAHLATILPVEFKHEQVWLAGRNVTTDIRSESCSDVASKISVFQQVRNALLARQQKFAELPGLVADGRDMGTVVFPEAFLKIYLDASVEERAKRRFLQLNASGYNVNLPDLVADLMQRDVRDKTRAVAPLKPAPEAIIIDSSMMKIEEVRQLIIDQVQQRLSEIN